MTDSGIHVAAEPELSPEQPQVGVFVRREDKFGIPRERVEAFLADVLSWMEPSYPDPRTRWTEIRSIYLDSPSLMAYYTHIYGAPSRLKARLRQYSPDSTGYLPDWHVEIKEKSLGLTRKVRFTVDALGAETILAGLPLPMDPATIARLLTHNESLGEKKLSRRIDRFNRLLLAQKLTPSVEVRYKRYAFQRGDERLTLDDDVRWTWLRATPPSEPSALQIPKILPIRAPQQAVDLEKDCVIETKTVAGASTWMLGLLAEGGAREARFSKYCASVEAHFPASRPQAAPGLRIGQNSALIPAEALR